MAPLLDAQQADSLRSVIGDEAWVQTVAAFRRTAYDSVAAIRDGAGRDGAPLVRITHTLKGTAANIGAVRLSRLASLLEQRVQSLGGCPADDPLAEALGSVADATLDALSSHIRPAADSEAEHAAV